MRSRRGAATAAIGAAGRSPTRRLLAIFDGLKEWFRSDDFKGCAFIRALSEYPDPDHPIHQAAWKHKRGMNQRVRTIATDADVKNPGALADSISLLIDGAIVAAHATRSDTPADLARSTAQALLKANC